MSEMIIFDANLAPLEDFFTSIGGEDECYLEKALSAFQSIGVLNKNGYIVVAPSVRYIMAIVHDGDFLSQVAHDYLCFLNERGRYQSSITKVFRMGKGFDPLWRVEKWELDARGVTVSRTDRAPFRVIAHVTELLDPPRITCGTYRSDL